MVVRCFEDDNVTHVEGGPDPLRDIEIINIEMSLADLATLQKRADKLAREARANPKLAPRVEALGRLSAALENGTPARSFAADSLEAEVAREAFLLTAKPMLYVANVDEAQIRGHPDRWRAMSSRMPPRRIAAPSPSRARSKRSSPA